MSLTLRIQPEIERRLLVQAHAKGLSPADFAKKVLMQASNPTQLTS